MPSLTAVVTCHNNPQGLRHVLGVLRYQTRHADEIIVLHSDTSDIPRLKEEFPEVDLWIEDENRQDWGHHKRDIGMRRASKTHVGFFNDDDDYSNTYIEKMMNEIEAGHDIAFCGWNTIPDCGFGMASSTSGNFIFNKMLGIWVGYTSRAYEADGHFIEKLRTSGARIAKVHDVLYFHNKGVNA